MPWWALVSLGVFLAAIVALTVFAAFAYGRVKRMAAAVEAIEARLDGLASAGEALERKLASAEARSEEVERHARRLQGSLERLSVLTWALGDARKNVGRLREAYLRK